MTEVLAALVAAAGSVVSVYVAVHVRRVEQAVNGRTEELVDRVAELEAVIRALVSADPNVRS